ncbi:MAG: PAS domain S-box protein [Telmatospirillum sp.]|nr:PAS domain S-box protein [Telmatospirillum sp.]
MFEAAVTESAPNMVTETCSPPKSGPLALAFLSALCLAGGLLGQQLSVSATGASLVWPPAGLALGAVLLLGNRALWAVVAGALALAFGESVFTPDRGSEPMAVAAAGGAIAIGVFQAWAGGYLMRRQGGFRPALDDKGSVLALLGLGGAGTGLLGAILDVCLSLALHPAQAGDLLFDASCRWAGTILGVALFAPLLLAWWPGEAPCWPRRRTAVTLCLAVFFLGAWLLVGYARSREQETARQELDELAATLTGQLEKNVTLYVDALASLQSVLMSGLAVDQESYVEIASRTQSRLPGVQAMNWAPVIDASERADYERDIISRQMDGLGIKDRRGQGWITAGPRDQYAPVFWVEPVIANRSALGFDLLSDPIRRESIERARDGGHLVFSRPVDMTTGGKGLLAVFPVYRRGPPHDTLENRRKAMRGVVVGAFRPSELASDALRKSAETHVIFWLVDQTSPPSQDVLVANAVTPPGVMPSPAIGPFGVAPSLQSSRSLDVGGRVWTVRLAPTPAFLEANRQSATWYVLFATVAFIGFASGAVLVATGRETALRRIADERTGALAEIESINRHFRQEAEKRFQAIVDNIGEAVILMDGEGSIETFNRAAEVAFGCSAADVIGEPASILAGDSDCHRLAPRNERFQRQAAGAKSRRPMEITAVRRDGSPFPAELTVDELAGLDSVRYLLIIHDISHRKEIERSLRESERRFRDLAGSASDWFWETDADYNLTFVSERIGAILGVKAAEIQGLSYFDLGLDDLPEVARAHRADIAKHAAFRDLVFHVGPSGEAKDSKFIRLSGIPLFDRDGTFTGYRGIGADITREMAAEQRATVAQQQMSDAIDSVGDAIAVYDSDDHLVICNAAFKTIFGEFGHLLQPAMAFGDMLDMGHDLNVFHTGGEVYETWKKRRLEQHLEATGLPFVIRLQDGRWIQHREFRTRDGGVIGVRSDITEAKRREEILQDLQRRYALILDSAGDGIIGLDGAGIITFANRTAGSLLGHDTATMIGVPFERLTQPMDPQSASEAPHLSGVPGDSRQTGTAVLRRGDGQSLPADYLLAPLVDDGNAAGAVLVFRDATLRLQFERSQAEQQRELERQVMERTAELTQEMEVRRRVEDALRESRERHKSVTDNLFEGVIAVDRHGHVIFANPSALRLLRWSADGEEVEGYPLDEVLRLRTRTGDIGFEGSPWQGVLATGKAVQDDDAQFVTPAGTVIAVAYACSSLPRGDLHPGVVISFRDIGVLKQAQWEAIQASRLASVGQLAAGIAHEINTPVQYVGDNLRYVGKSLTKVLTVLDAGNALAEQARQRPETEPAAVAYSGAVTAAKLGTLTEEMTEAIDESLQGVAQIARIVLSMKEFSHPGTSSKTATDLNKAIESTLTVSRNVWKHAAEVDRDLDPDLPTVICHAGEMNQVFLNLIVNAAHAIESSGKPLPGRIRITTRTIDGDRIEVRVADNGTGIPDAIKEKIFDPFFTTKEVGKGTGQGLAICRDVVVTKHGGTIDLGGAPGEGAEFIVRLPLGREKDGYADDELDEEARA